LDVHVIPVTWESHQSALRAIRQQVFVFEQNIPEELEFDGDDLIATHYLVLNSAGQHLGCARLLASGMIGRVAVLSEARGTGLGKALVEACVTGAQELGIDRVFLHAQTAAERFYHKLEFRRTGTEFVEAGIPHIGMERALPIPFTTQDLKKSTIVRNDVIPKPNVDDAPRKSELREFDSEDGAIEQLHSVIASARRSIRIYSPELDHALFDSEPLATLISEFARSAAGCQVDILINNSSLIVARGHLLIELGRRLDEKLVLRRLPETTKGDQQSWLVVDNCALWVQSEPDEYRGWSDTFNPVQAERFGTRFTQFWDRSGPDPELRVLRL